MRFLKALAILPLHCFLVAAAASAQTGTLTPTVVTASNSTTTDVPSRATDGNLNTSWSAGSFAPQWIQLDLGQQYTISKVRLNVMQSPNGHTVHQVYGGPTPDALSLIGTLDGVTQDRQWLALSSSASRVRYLRVTTVESPSWIAWREIQVHQGLQYYSYFASAMSGVGTGNYTAEISDHSNVTWIAGGSTSDHVTKLSQARSRNMGAVLNVSTVFFDLSDFTLQPNYQANWNSYADAVQPFAPNIVAFYPLDEPFLQNRPRDELKHDLETVISLIKQRFPTKAVAVIFGYPTVSDTSNFVIPVGYDWVGFDCYPQTSGTFDDCFGHSIPWYVNTIKSRLNPNQRMIMVPEGVYFGTAPPSSSFQNELVDRADRFFTLAQSDPSFVGLFTFIYQSQQTQTEHWFGTRDMPVVKTKYRQIGQDIINPSYWIIYPSAVTASSSATTDPPSRVIDGDLSTTWNAGGFAPRWIQLDLGQQYAISKVRLNVAQTPAGHTTHQVYGGSTPNNLSLIGTLDGMTQDGQWLELVSSANNIRYLRISTVASPSWVSWSEIQVFR